MTESIFTLDEIRLKILEAEKLSRSYQYLPQPDQDKLLTSLTARLFELDPQSDFSFEGQNDYGFNLAVAVSRGYGLSIDICWDKDCIWIFRDSGYVHPNLATVTGKKAIALIEDLKKLVIKWAFGVNHG